MTPQRFDAVFEDFVTAMRRLMKTKGGEYQRTADVLSNFKLNATDLDLTPFDVWAVYASKHYDALRTHVKDRREHKDRPASEPIYGRAVDLANYMILFVALYEDAKPRPEDPVMQLIWDSNHEGDSK